jgi:hypothetical protein
MQALHLAKTLFSKDKLEPIGDWDLSYTCPLDSELYIGCFGIFPLWPQRNSQSTIHHRCRNDLPSRHAQRYGEH